MAAFPLNPILRFPLWACTGTNSATTCIVGIGTTVPFVSNYNNSYVRGSGIFVSSSAVNPEVATWPPMAQGLIIEGNSVTNTLAGVHLGNTSHDTMLHNNRFDGNAVAINDDWSVRTFQLVGGRLLLPSARRTQSK